VTTRVIAAGSLMIAAQVIFRGWALYPSWFYTDDYRLLYDARHHGLTWSYLVSPFDSQFMPAGRLAAWLLSSSGQLNWTLAATMTLGVQALASAACLWMLCTVFGRRPEVLLPLGLYLTSAINMPALMWWAAGLNQVPLQAVFFAAVALGVRYLRTRRPLWLLLTTLVVGLGLLCYVKALLVVPVLVFLAAAYWATGSLRDRVVTVLRRYWAGASLLGVLCGTYVVYYLTHVPQAFQGDQRPVLGPLADTMLGTSLMSGIWGGPWSWSRTNPPVGYADPPAWSVHLAWSALLLVVLYGVLTRVRTLRPWLLLAGYVGVLFLLVATTRAPIAGGAIGLEYRYLTDAVCALTLCVSLAFLPVTDAVESTAPREEPLLLVRVRTRHVTALVALVCLSGLVSSAGYVRIWHTDNPGDDFVHRLRADLQSAGTVDLADAILPPNVIPAFSYPYNTTRRLVPLIDAAVRFPAATPRLRVLDVDGSVHPALIRPTSTGLVGPVPDCGWRARAPGLDVPLTNPTPGVQSWVRIGYLSSADSPVRVKTGGTVVVTQVQGGLHSLYVHTDQVFDQVSIEGLDPGTTVCVDTVEVGDPVPAEEGIS
jgi:hypothetical protein